MKYPTLIAAVLAVSFMQNTAVAAQLAEPDVNGVNSQLEAMIDSAMADALRRDAAHRFPARAGVRDVSGQSDAGTGTARHVRHGTATEFGGLYPAL